MLPTLLRRVAEKPGFIRSAASGAGPVPGPYSRYRPKKVWPPDFSKLSQREQFRFEKRYKRRVKLATARPRWEKFVKLAQLSSVTFVLIYSVLFMDWNTETQPFQGLRDRFWGVFGSFSPAQRHERRS